MGAHDNKTAPEGSEKPEKKIPRGDQKDVSDILISLIIHIIAGRIQCKLGRGQEELRKRTSE